MNKDEKKIYFGRLLGEETNIGIGCLEVGRKAGEEAKKVFLIPVLPAATQCTVTDDQIEMSWFSDILLLVDWF